MEPNRRPVSAIPSVPVRILAFVAIVALGLVTAVIGDAFVGLQCRGACVHPRGVGAIVGALIGSIGTAVLAVLVMRAMGEWKTIRERDAQRLPDQP